MDIPSRKHLVRRVRAALAAPFSAPLYLYGPPSTGKRSTLSEAAGDGHCVTVDCVLNHTERQLFTAIAGVDYNVSDASTLIEILRTTPPTEELHILIFNRAERLSPSSFPLLFRLSSLCERSDLRVVFASRVAFSSLRYSLVSGGPGVGNAHGHPVSTPTTIFFNPLSESEIVSALTKVFSKQAQIATPSPVAAIANVNKVNGNTNIEQIYSGFATSVVQILYRTSNNPFHLQRVTDALFPEYVKALQERNPIAAFNRVRDRLNDTLTALTTDFSICGTQKENNESSLNHMQQDDKTQGLPRTARILLVAAFLGRVIAPSHDMRHFSAERTGRRAGAQKVEGDNAVPLERLLAIYRAIRPQGLIEEENALDLTADSVFYGTRHMDETLGDNEEERNMSVSCAISTAALVHLSTLVALGWLSRDGTGDIALSEPKYRCKLSRTDAVKIATTLDMPIHDYLVFESK